MNLDSLKLDLERLGIKKRWYSLSEEFADEAFCIHRSKERELWEVYYCERGEKSNLRTFKSEDEACEWFYHFITSDHVVMSHLEK